MKSPIEEMMDRLDWEAIEQNAKPDGSLPYATHTGVLKIGDFEIRCYRLSDGKAIVDAEDFNKFFDLASSQYIAHQ